MVYTFPGLGSENSAFAGEDLKVLMAKSQHQAPFQVHFTFRFSQRGVQGPDVRLHLPILYAPVQCTDELACNFNDQSWLDSTVNGPSAGDISGGVT